MRKTLIVMSFFIAVSSVSLYAQKNEKNSRDQYYIELKSSNDSLSYAYGVGTAEQGLIEYIKQLGVIADTAKIEADYRQKIDLAKTNVEKENLKKKLNTSIDSANSVNTKNIDLFLQGINTRINSNEDRAYNSGLDLGSQIEKIAESFSSQVLEGTEQINVQAMVLGIADVLQNKPTLINNPPTLIESRMNQLKEKEALKKKEEYNKVIASGEKFMKKNAKRKGVISLPSGLQYTVVKAGKGAIPKANDKVKVHYTGRLTDGTVFDSSVDRGEPISFEVQQVIAGWTEILQLMPVGSKWTVYIPYNLAYGDKGAGSIKPYSNLIFDIELLDIE